MLVLIDSSIWIDHINKGKAGVADLLKQRRVLLHPMIIGEIALGSIRQRKRILQELQTLPQVPTAGHAEVMAMIEWLELGGVGVGYVDAHLLASTRQVTDGILWTSDKRLHTQAERLDVAYRP